MVVIVLAAVAVAIVAGVQANEKQEQEVLRIHIRANSDSEQDQRIKLEVRDAVVAYLTPVLAECQGLSEAKGAVAARQSEIERRAEHVLEAAGYRYGCTVKLTREEFPARTYDGLTLEEGIYDALIVELGDAEGANVLILDEPTNHLDMEAITALNNGMIKFPGVILFSSRDHQIVQTTANRIMEIVPGGQLIDKITTYDEYLESDEMARKRQTYSVQTEEND